MAVNVAAAAAHTGTGRASRNRKKVCLALSLLFMLPSAVASPMDCDASSAAGTVEPVRLRVGLEWFLNPDHLPLVVALKMGYFEQVKLDLDAYSLGKANLSVELRVPSDHWEADGEIRNGNIDVALTEPLHLAQDAAAGRSVVGFSRFFHTDGGIMFLRESGITRPRDMCGKTISYPGYPGVGGPAIAQTMVEADGGECDIESYGKHDGGFHHTEALKSRKADLATLIFSNFELVEAQHESLNPGFFSLKEWGVPDFCQLVLFTTPERFEQLKPALRRMVLAMRQAVGLIHRNPTSALQVYDSYLSSHGGLPTEKTEADKHAATLAATLPAFPNDNAIAPEYFEELMRWLAKTKQVDKIAAAATKPAHYWTNEIAL